jgi:hypothetical protein
MIIVMPSEGTAVETTTKRRYVLIKVITFGPVRAYIESRSDSIRALMRLRERCSTSPHLHYYLGDTITGKSIMVGGNGGPVDVGWLAGQLAPEPQIDQAHLLMFVRDVAHLRPDGEGTDDEGEPWVMENDDAVDTLCGLIGEARAILGEPRDQPERWQS